MAETLNWVERRARCQHNLSRHAVEVWESARTAIDNCCASFNQHFSELAHVKNQTENGHRVRVIITFGMHPRATRNVAIEFSGSDVTVTVDGGAAKRFEIAADENHAFLKYGQEEISADKFTELALDNAFFRLPPAPGPSRSTRSFAQRQSDYEG